MASRCEQRRLLLKGAAAFLLLPQVARAAASSRLDAAVVGAGLAGLKAALDLEAAGAKVGVFEASPRVGGRLFTLEREGLRFEVGAVEIGAAYGRFRSLAARFGLPLEPMPPPAGGDVLLLLADGERRASAWGAAPHPLSAGTPFAAVPPPQLLARLLAADDSLPQAAAWLQEAHRSLDRPLAEHLVGRGLPLALLPWVEVGANYNSLARVSALDALRRDRLRRETDPQVLRLVGGIARLPEAMAQALKTPVRLGARLLAVEQDRRGVTLRFADGARARAERAVLALPPPALAVIRFSPPLPAALAEALALREMTAITTIHLRPRRAFWEEDGLPPAMWVEGALERVFAVPGEGPGGIERLIVWINGDAARRLDALSEEEIGRWAELELLRLRPSTRGALRLLAVRSWGRDPLAGGAYAEIRAGGCARVAAAPLDHGRVHFAGEHTEFRLLGMEAALASGERAAREVAGR